MLKPIACSLFSVLALAAADVTGKWSGSFDITMNGETKADTAYLDLKQSGETVTGTAGPNSEKQWKLRNGKVDGEHVTFEVLIGERPDVMYMDLRIEGEHLKGTAQGESGENKMTAKVDVTRQPAGAARLSQHDERGFAALNRTIERIPLHRLTACFPDEPQQFRAAQTL